MKDSTEIELEFIRVRNDDKTTFANFPLFAMAHERILKEITFAFWCVSQNGPAEKLREWERFGWCEVRSACDRSRKWQSHLIHLHT